MLLSDVYSCSGDMFCVTHLQKSIQGLKFQHSTRAITGFHHWILCIWPANEGEKRASRGKVLEVSPRISINQIDQYAKQRRDQVTEGENEKSLP